MDRIGRFIVEHAKVVLALTALLSVLSVLMLFRMSFNANVSSFLLEGNETGQEFVELQEKYDTPDPVNVMASLPEGEAFTTAANIALIAELGDALSQVEGVEAVASVVPETNPVTGAPLDASAIRAAPDELVAGAIAQNPMSELLVSEDGQHTLLFVSPGDDATATAGRILDVEQEGLDLTFSGNPVVFASVIDLLSWFLLIIPPVVIGLLILVFYSTIGDLRLSALALVPAALGSLWTFGTIFALGRQVDIVTVIVPIFVIVMGSADGLHFVTHFQEVGDRTHNPIDRVTSALREVGVPMILTTVSTAAGFLSLLATDVQPIRQLGVFTALGIVFAGCISFFSLPAIISVLGIESGPQKAWLGPSLTRGIKAAVKTRIPALLISAGILVFAVWAIPQLTVNPDQLFFFKDNDPVRVSFDKTTEVFGGATPLIGEFAFNPENPQLSIADAQQATVDLEGMHGVRSVVSLASIAGSGSAEEVVGSLGGDRDLPGGSWISDDGMRFTLLPSDFEPGDLDAWVAYADESEAVVVLTGMPVVWNEIARLVLNAQATSLVVAYILVAIMLLMAYRSFVETLVSLVPITLTLLVLLGFIAASGIHLNLLTAVVSSIILGVGIDYAIHYIAAISIARRDGEDFVDRAIDKAGRPIVANALGIAVAMTALWLSPLKIHGQISMIMWVSMITAAATTLIVIPGLLPRNRRGDPGREAGSR